VHYPSDVLAGALIGAGYAVAVAVAIESAWQFIGKKWFPRWHATMPSLMPNLNLEIPSAAEHGR
jgi:membrane-associated phospholipid phosphatase